MMMADDDGGAVVLDAWLVANPPGSGVTDNAQVVKKDRLTLDDALSTDNAGGACAPPA
jgi:hypothetical protein